MTLLTVVANRPSPTNIRLGPVLGPARALTMLGPGDVAVVSHHEADAATFMAMEDGYR